MDYKSDKNILIALIYQNLLEKIHDLSIKLNYPASENKLEKLCNLIEKLTTSISQFSKQDIEEGFKLMEVRRIMDE